MTHGYFADKARTVFARAGGDPDLSGQLAEWAERVRPTNDSRLGVIVTDDGVIRAETSHNPEAHAAYVTACDLKDDGWTLVDLEVGLATGRIAYLTGHRSIHVRFSQVCLGAGAHA